MEHKNPSDSIFIFMGLFIPNKKLVVFNSSKRKLFVPKSSTYVYIKKKYIYIFQLNKRFNHKELKR